MKVKQMFFVYVVALILLGSVASSAIDLISTIYKSLRAKRTMTDFQDMMDGSMAFLEDRYRQICAEREEFMGLRS
jgi:Sec-independent protein translocase protein TatA